MDKSASQSAGSISVSSNGIYSYGRTSKTTVTVEEFDDKGKLVKRTITTTEYENPNNFQPAIPYQPYPYHPIWASSGGTVQYRSKDTNTDL